ncbi:hypothetical protein ACE193_11770 [Bernardetia sp. OM2101]|uniref:hypothetical protein n=1 Tax=Bernardetia sp. OM2101 TaxID=3344876 RepID=UPI0035CEC426
MKKLIFFSIFFALCFSSFAQTNINTSIGYSTHGSGDMFGYAVSFGVGKTLPKVSNRLSLGFNARFMTHSREYEMGYLNQTLPSYQNSNLRVVTSGSQLEIVPAFALIKSEGFSFHFHAGILVRYEVTNSPNIFGYTMISDREVSLTVINDDTNDFKSFDVGYISQFSMQFKISKRSQLGIAMSFQNDTNGSAITSIPLSYYFSL